MVARWSAKTRLLCQAKGDLLSKRAKESREWAEHCAHPLLDILDERALLERSQRSGTSASASRRNSTPARSLRWQRPGQRVGYERDRPEYPKERMASKPSASRGMCGSLSADWLSKTELTSVHSARSDWPSRKLSERPQPVTVGLQPAILHGRHKYYGRIDTVQPEERQDIIPPKPSAVKVPTCKRLPTRTDQHKGVVSSHDQNKVVAVTLRRSGRAVNGRTGSAMIRNCTQSLQPCAAHGRLRLPHMVRRIDYNGMRP